MTERIRLTPTIKIKKLHESAVMPSLAHEGDACVDLRYCPQGSNPEDAIPFYLGPSQTTAIPTGIALEIPVGWEAQIRSRSGLAAKRQLFVLNSPGTIDSGYRGEIAVILHNASVSATLEIQPGDRIAQMCFKPVYSPRFEVVDELSPAQRGPAGLGSTGVK